TQLGSFAAEVTRVAREVGTEGKLGGQAKVKGVAGTWKDLTDNVNLMAGNLTGQDRKSTRLNSSHSQISYAVFCLKKKQGIVKVKPPSLPAGHLRPDADLPRLAIQVEPPDAPALPVPVAARFARTVADPVAPRDLI